MSERFLYWLGRKASDYLVWLDQRERDYNRKLTGPCPDCGEGPLYCYCDESYERQRWDQDAYDGGYVDGYQRAWEEAA